MCGGGAARRSYAAAEAATATTATTHDAMPVTVAQVQSLLTTTDSAQRHKAYALLEECDEVEIAVAAIPHLCRLLGTSAADVGRDEFQRVGNVLVILTHRGDNVRPCLEFTQQEWDIFWHAEDSVFTRTLKRPVDELGAVDVLPFAPLFAATNCIWARGGSPTWGLIEDPAPVELEMKTMLAWSRNTVTPNDSSGHPKSNQVPDAFCFRMIKLALQLLGSDGDALSGYEKTAIWVRHQPN